MGRNFSKTLILLAILVAPACIVWGQAADSVLMGQGAGIIPKYTGVPNCTYASYSTSSHAWSCGPTPTATATPALPIAFGGTGVTYGAPQTSLLTAASGSYTTPTGATWLYVCVFGAGGGGGAATSGGAAAVAGGGGSAGTSACAIIQTPSGSYVFANGAGGTAGTCSATPTVAGDGTGNTTFGPSGNGQLLASPGKGGATASTTVNGNGGAAVTSGMTVQSAGLQNQNVMIINNSVAGHVGVGDVTTPLGSFFPGASGGTGYTVTSGGVCHNASTAGSNGFIVATAYFN